MSRSTTSLASSHTEVDRYDRLHRVDDTLNRLAEIEKRIPEIEKRTSSKDGRQSSRSTPTSSSTPDRNSSDRDKKKHGGPPRGPPGQGEPGSPNELFQPKTVKFWLTLVANFLAIFLVALDRTIVATATPTITDEFHSLGNIGWYGSAYMLTNAASQLVFGRVFKYYNMKW